MTPTSRWAAISGRPRRSWRIGRATSKPGGGPPRVTIVPAGRGLARRPAGPSLWTWLAVSIAVVLAGPIAAGVSSLPAPAGDGWLPLRRTQPPDLLGQTLL